MNNSEYIAISSYEEEGVIPEASSLHITCCDERVKNERPASDNDEDVSPPPAEKSPNSKVHCKINK